jgi:type VI secretion system protein ImpM
MNRLPLLGWYGKLPASGDFVGRGLPRETVQRLDSWFQNGLIQIRHRTPDWQRFFAWSTPWHCVLSGAVTGSVTVEAHLCASADRVGRLFPLIACYELPPGTRRFVGASEWHRKTAQLVNRTIRDQLTADQFDAELKQCSASATAYGTGFGTQQFGSGADGREDGNGNGNGNGDIMSVLNSGPSTTILPAAVPSMDDFATLPMPLTAQHEYQSGIALAESSLQSIWWPTIEPRATPIFHHGELTNALFLSLFMR